MADVCFFVKKISLAISLMGRVQGPLLWVTHGLTGLIWGGRPLGSGGGGAVGQPAQQLLCALAQQLGGQAPKGPGHWKPPCPEEKNTALPR